MDVRVVQIDGAPWFAAADACRALGFQINQGAHRYVAKLADDEKGRRPIAGVGGPQQTWVISESGLYKLIMRSDKSVARRCQDWVTRDVLPAIRKDGAYVAGEEKLATGEKRLVWRRELPQAIYGSNAASTTLISESDR